MNHHDEEGLFFPLGRREKNSDRQIQAWYDTREGLEARLEQGGLNGLREIALARREAGYGRKERMAEWCLLGYFYTDTCGNLSPLTEGAPIDAYQFMKYEGRFPTVLSKDEMLRYTARWAATLEGCIPPVDGRCDRCGEGWTLDNVRDFYWRPEKPPRHRECHRLAVIEREIKDISDIVRRSEIPFSDFYMVPTQYFPDPDYFGPWFMLETPLGRIKIGWRKRVINIDWSGAKIHVSPELFQEEDVTQSSTYIHAWTREKAVEYLKQLWAAGTSEAHE